MSSDFEKQFEETESTDHHTSTQSDFDASQLWGEMQTHMAAMENRTATESILPALSVRAMNSPSSNDTEGDGPPPSSGSGDSRDEKRPYTGEEPGDKNEGKDELPQGDRPESEESRRTRLEQERLHNMGQTSGLLLMLALRGDAGGVTSETLDTLGGNLAQLANDSQRLSYLAGMNRVLAGFNRQIQYVTGTDAAGNPTTRLQLQDRNGNPLPIGSRWDGRRR